MLTDEERQCVVCFCSYSRSERIPRLLHCEHTFCAPCMLKLCRPRGAVCTIRCPLCRWITCTCASVPLPCSLYVNTKIWDQLGEEKEEDEDARAPIQLQMRSLRESKTSSKKCALKVGVKKIWSCVHAQEQQMQHS